MSEIHNPFEQLGQKVDAVLGQLVEIGKMLRQPKAPEWERISVAMKRRKKARATLMAAVQAGKVERRIEPAPGGDGYLLKVADLDRLFPVLQ